MEPQLDLTNLKGGKKVAVTGTVLYVDRSSRRKQYIVQDVEVYVLMIQICMMEMTMMRVR